MLESDGFGGVVVGFLLDECVDDEAVCIDEVVLVFLIEVI